MEIVEEVATVEVKIDPREEDSMTVDIIVVSKITNKEGAIEVATTPKDLKEVLQEEATEEASEEIVEDIEATEEDSEVEIVAIEEATGVEIAEVETWEEMTTNHHRERAPWSTRDREVEIQIAWILKKDEKPKNNRKQKNI